MSNRLKMTLCNQIKSHETHSFIEYQNARNSEILIEQKLCRYASEKRNKQISINIEKRNELFHFVILNIGVFLFDIDALLILSSLCNEFRSLVFDTIHMRIINDVKFISDIPKYFNMMDIIPDHFNIDYESIDRMLHQFDRKILSYHVATDPYNKIVEHTDEYNTYMNNKLLMRLMYVRYLQIFRKRLFSEDLQKPKLYTYKYNYDHNKQKKYESVNYDEIEYYYGCVDIVEQIRSGNIVNINYSTYKVFEYDDNFGFTICPNAEKIKQQNTKKYIYTKLHKHK